MVFVRLIPEDRLRRLVEVRGEIHYPGYYAISEDATRLSEVIAWAGGVTPEAFLREAKVVRRGALKLEDKEYERLKDLPPSEMTPDEYEYFKLKSREQQGLMVVDFERLLLENDTAEDLTLKRGDLITIPTHRDFVSVLGMVRSPGNVTFEPDLTPELYILKSGGYANRADRRHVRVIRGATSEWVPLSAVDFLEPGDTIWIPEKRDRDWWAIFKDTLATTTQILTLYLIVDTAVSD
jgi:protein involved in polysaccharide export with SLBB domain